MQPSVCTGIYLSPSTPPRRIWGYRKLMQMCDARAVLCAMSNEVLCLWTNRPGSSASIRETVASYCGSLQGGWILRPFTVVNSFINKDGKLTVTGLSGRMMRKSWFLTGDGGSPGELVGNMLCKLYGQPGRRVLCFGTCWWRAVREVVAVDSQIPVQRCLGCATSPPGRRTSPPIWQAASSPLHTN